MNMPSFFRPIFFIPLVIVFSLVFGASVIYYNKADILVSLVKHFASSSLDLHVETTGKASVTFDGSLMSIDIDDITAQVSSDEALPIARVSGLYVRINLQNVFNGSIEIDQIETKGATLYSNISSKKWLKSQMAAGDDLVSAPIDVLFGEIALNNIKIEFVDPLLGNVENIEFTTLSVSDQGSDNKHKIDINVVIKEDILNLSGLFQNFDEFMLKTKPLIFELTGASHGLAISTSGQLSDLNSDEISHANWNIHAEDLPTWLSLIDPRISLVKGIDTSGEITANDKQVTLNNTVLNLSGDAGKISFSPKGQFVFAPNLKNSSWDFKGDLAFDLTKSKLLLGELVDECPECRRIKGQSTFLFSNKLLALTDLSLDLGLGEDKLEFKAQQFEADLSNLSEDKAKITTTQADIKYHTKDNKEVLVYGYSADDATVDVLSREEIRWHSNGKYLDIPIQLKGHSTGSGLLWSHKISGQLDDAPLELVAAQKEKTIELDIQLDVPDVKLLSRFLL